MEHNKINDLLNSAKKYLTEKDIIIISKAIDFSSKAHVDQLRNSGEPYISHPLEVAKILTEIKLDTSSIVSGLLHDTVEDTSVSINDIKKIFGDEIASLVEGLTKINKFSLKINNQKYGENYRKLLLAATSRKHTARTRAGSNLPAL